MDGAPAEEEGIHQWSELAQVPKPLRKYWYQRYLVWDRYDEGVWMTEHAWFGVTPESIANTIAVHLSEAVSEEKDVIIDAFAGVGGNAIAFAREGRWKQIFAIEKDPATMKCAKHNAKIYGVEDKITWITGDCFDVLEERFRDMGNTVVFASPPWGGSEYSDVGVFDLEKMQPYNLETLFKAFTRISNNLVLYLPRTSDLNQIAKYAPLGKKLEVTHYCIKGASKALCVYFGDYNFPAADEEEEKAVQTGQ
ncbi:S-adenosyl-L-methionine-dependent methyltransferase [Sporormia fimetaria CBS 119925]|uniref:Trimethylguanosine synthase n=1 Tax=Sporormia fimetaria CBS 119925 TaxID=1340428 RepID=A0A6A6VSM4_9PLEO|nr:S-adenosyl-L-methionine-dependent methyltransferase [Sporormia fimetaria CBS 119925]